MANQITPNPSVPSQVVAEVKFPKFINNLGIIPTSYKDSMDYYQNLAWLCKYLEETVIPSVNQNGNAVQELQNLYIKLNSYVTHYFDNLDVQEEINNKLDDLVQDGTLTQLIGVYIHSDIIPLIEEQNQEIDNQNDRISDIQTLVASLSSGSPSGVYSSVEALTSDDPDHSKIYVVTATGNWYYYNGETWASGGVYQSTMINNNSVTPEMTTFITKEVGKNKFDKNEIISGFWIGKSNETPIANADIGYYLSDDLIAGKTYCVSNNGINPHVYISCFNSAGTNLLFKEIVTQGDTFTVPATATKIYISNFLNRLDDTQIEEGETVTYFEEYTKIYKTKNGLYSNVLDKSITTEKTDFIEEKTGTNKFDVSSLIHGYYVGGGGYNPPTQNDITSYYETFDLKPNTTYITNAHLIVSCYNGYNNVYIKEINNGTFTTPAEFTKAFISIFNNTLTSNTRINEGTTLLEYESYEKYNELENIKVPLENIIGDKINNYTIVDINGSGDYTSLADAVNNSSSNDVIVVYPGVYDNEVVECWGKTLYIIGIDKNKCIIKNHNCDYATPPIEFSSGLLKNLTFISEYDETNYNNTQTHSYAIHIEDNNLSNNKLTIENCKFESQVNYGFGMGMRGGCNVEVNNCELIGSDGNYIENINVTHGGMFFHDASNADYSGSQTILVKDCIISTQESLSHNYPSIDLRIDSQEIVGSIVDVTFNNCTVVNEKTGDSNITLRNANQQQTVQNINDLVNFVLTYKSYGNNNNKLNP